MTRTLVTLVFTILTFLAGLTGSGPSFSTDGAASVTVTEVPPSRFTVRIVSVLRGASNCGSAGSAVTNAALGAGRLDLRDGGAGSASTVTVMVVDFRRSGAASSRTTSPGSSTASSAGTVMTTVVDFWIPGEGGGTSTTSTFCTAGFSAGTSLMTVSSAAGTVVTTCSGETS
ncbi:hypothetical protein BC567DRAFT_213771 [Phyllosticta citribraziliensis]